MAEGDRTTLAVAVAGITATALVGLAGTAAAWLSARNDRAAQHELSRDERAAQQELARAERRYDRRVAAYLDAIDFVEGQKTSVLETVSQATYWVRGPRPALPATSLGKLRSLPYTDEAPSRLVSRLRAFGSKEVLAAFQKTQEQSYNLPMCVIRGAIDMSCTFNDNIKGIPLIGAYEKFEADILRFEELVRREVG